MEKSSLSIIRYGNIIRLAGSKTMTSFGKKDISVKPPKEFWKKFLLASRTDSGSDGQIGVVIIGIVIAGIVDFSFATRTDVQRIGRTFAIGGLTFNNGLFCNYEAQLPRRGASRESHPRGLSILICPRGLLMHGLYFCVKINISTVNLDLEDCKIQIAMGILEF